MTWTKSLLFALLCCAHAACGPDAGTDTEHATAGKLRQSWRDIRNVELAVDVSSRRATATLELAPSKTSGASFEVGDLDVTFVGTGAGPRAHRRIGERLDVAAPAGKTRVRVEYGFALQPKLEGALAHATFLWPYHCGNLYPCKSDPADGLRFSLELTGVPPGQTAVYARSIPADAPPYMLAWAIGDYTRVELGTTAHGRKVSVHYLPGEKAKALAATEKLAQIFEWLETTYGGYLFGDEVGSVSANWGEGAFGGMEHHPYWHVSHDSMGDEEVHAHEAAHGWFGNGVRLACWEDLTLSEGTTSYAAVRAIDAVRGPAAAAKVWKEYEAQLDAVIASEDRIAWPRTCGEIDVYTDLWNDVVYMKGAFFYRAIEKAVGREAIDRALAAFYAEHRGRAASMQDMLVAIERETGFDPQPLAEGWLGSLGRPD
jgi:hypothetical protein